jgi:predicted phage tail protein
VAYVVPNQVTENAPTTATAGNITVNWTAGSVTGTNAPQISGYNVYNGGTLLTATPVTGTSYNVAATTGTTYTLTVAAVNAAGTGTQSTARTVVYTAPNAPGKPAAGTILPPANGATTDTVPLSWTAPTAVTNQPGVTSYLIEYSTSATFASVLGSTTSTTTSANVSVPRGTTAPALPSNTFMYFRVKAVNPAGTGTASTISNAVTLR